MSPARRQASKRLWELVNQQYAAGVSSAELGHLLGVQAKTVTARLRSHGFLGGPSPSRKRVQDAAGPGQHEPLSPRLVDAAARAQRANEQLVAAKAQAAAARDELRRAVVAEHAASRPSPWLLAVHRSRCEDDPPLAGSSPGHRSGRPDGELTLAQLRPHPPPRSSWSSHRAGEGAAARQASGGQTDRSSPRPGDGAPRQLHGNRSSAAACRMSSSGRRSYLAVTAGFSCPAIRCTITTSAPAASRSDTQVRRPSCGESRASPAWSARRRNRA